MSHQGDSQATHNEYTFLTIYSGVLVKYTSFASRLELVSKSWRWFSSSGMSRIIYYFRLVVFFEIHFWSQFLEAWWLESSFLFNSNALVCLICAACSVVHGVKWHDVVSHDMTWHDMAYDMVYDITYYMKWYDKPWCDIAWPLLSLEREAGPR